MTPTSRVPLSKAIQASNERRRRDAAHAANAANFGPWWVLPPKDPYPTPPPDDAPSGTTTAVASTMDMGEGLRVLMHKFKAGELD